MNSRRGCIEGRGFGAELGTSCAVLIFRTEHPKPCHVVDSGYEKNPIDARFIKLLAQDPLLFALDTACYYLLFNPVRVPDVPIPASSQCLTRGRPKS